MTSVGEYKKTVTAFLNRYKKLRNTVVPVNSPHASHLTPRLAWVDQNTQPQQQEANAAQAAQAAIEAPTEKSKLEEPSPDNVSNVKITFSQYDVNAKIMGETTYVVVLNPSLDNHVSVVVGQFNKYENPTVYYFYCVAFQPVNDQGSMEIHEINETKMSLPLLFVDYAHATFNIKYIRSDDASMAIKYKTENLSDNIKGMSTERIQYGNYLYKYSAFDMVQIYKPEANTLNDKYLYYYFTAEQYEENGILQYFLNVKLPGKTNVQSYKIPNEMFEILTRRKDFFPVRTPNASVAYTPQPSRSIDGGDINTALYRLAQLAMKRLS